MTVSLTAAERGTGGIRIPCILYEGVATVSANVMGPDGYMDTGISFAAPMYKDQYVTLDIQSDNTFDACRSMAVVKPLTAGSLIVGKIVTEPTLERPPSTTPTATWAAHLTGRYYRKATVWFPDVIASEKAVLVGASTANIVPGVQATLAVDASASNALAAAGGPVTLSVYDVANSGTGLFSFHYAASGAATVSLLVGFTGGVPLIGA